MTLQENEDGKFQLELRVPSGVTPNDLDHYEFCLYQIGEEYKQHKGMSKISRYEGIEYPKIPIFDLSSHQNGKKITTPFNMHLPYKTFDAIPPIIKNDIIDKNVSISSDLKIFLLAQDLPITDKASLSFFPHYATDPLAVPFNYATKRKIQVGLFYSDSQNVFFKGRELNEVINCDTKITIIGNNGECSSLLSGNGLDLELPLSQLSTGQSVWSYVNYYDETDKKQKAIVTLHWFLNKNQKTALLEMLTSLPVYSPLDRSLIGTLFTSLADDFSFKDFGGHVLKLFPFLELLGCLKKTEITSNSVNFFKSSPSSDSESVVCLSMPKSGSNLLQRVMKQLRPEYIRGFHTQLGEDFIHKAGQVFDSNGFIKIIDGKASLLDMWVSLCDSRVLKRKFIDILDNMPPNHFLMGHIQYNSILGDLLKIKNSKIIVLFREPKALALSMAHWISNPETSCLAGYFSSQPTMETVSRIFSGFDRNERTGVLGLVPLKWTYRLYAEWVFRWGALPIFYEDLVGENGGGTRERQIETIGEILQYIGQDVPLIGEIQNIGENAYGGTHTFRKGKSDIPEGSKAMFEEEFIASEIASINEILNLVRKIRIMRQYP